MHMTHLSQRLAGENLRTGLRCGVPVAELGSAEAGHGVLQVLPQVQNVLHRPLPLGLRVWDRKSKNITLLYCILVGSDGLI